MPTWTSGWPVNSCPVMGHAPHTISASNDLLMPSRFRENSMSEIEYVGLLCRCALVKLRTTLLIDIATDWHPSGFGGLQVKCSTIELRFGCLSTMSRLTSFSLLLHLFRSKVLAACTCGAAVFMKILHGARIARYDSSRPVRGTCF